MNWDKIIGQNSIKQHLQESIDNERISHAQMFFGEDGSGSLPIAWNYGVNVLSHGKPDILRRIEHFQHPDFHFTFPTVSLSKEKSLSNKAKKALSYEYIGEFKDFFSKNPYGTLDDWMKMMNVENQQAIISVEEIEDKLNKLSLKSYEGGYKVLLIWHAEKMNTQAANKFLKMLEEPPPKTLFLLVSDTPEKILPTIASRCQAVYLKRLEDRIIENHLISTYQIPEEKAKIIAFQANGSWSKALKLKDLKIDTLEFEKAFIEWTRNAFKAKANFRALRPIVYWSQNISSWGREKQKGFLSYCSEIFRQALIENYQTPQLVYQQLKEDNFNWKGFSKFIHGQNIEDILKDISEANYHIERNANPKIVFLDLGIQLIRYIHRNPT